MIEMGNEPMLLHTTLHIGGPAKVMLMPESEEEFIGAIKECMQRKVPYRILGYGSNILVSDRGVDGYVINNTKACLRLELEEGGVVYAGSSVRLQTFIRFCVNHDLGGHEYLFSVPGSIGGAVLMNAGLGAQDNKQISDYLLSVRAFDGQQTIIVPKQDCEFEHRRSIFQRRRNWVILGAYFKPPLQDKAIGEKKIKERMKFAKEWQDYNYPTAGSVFRSNSNRHCLWGLIRGLRWGKAAYSMKTPNWINNLGGATARQVLILMRVVEILNLLCFKKAVREIEYWE